jgi:hypothetical protein
MTQPRKHNHLQETEWGVMHTSTPCRLCQAPTEVWVRAPIKVFRPGKEPTYEKPDRLPPKICQRCKDYEIDEPMDDRPRRNGVRQITPWEGETL